MQTMTMPEILNDQHKWFRYPVRHHSGNLDEIGQWMPAFERCPFGFPNGIQAGRNHPHLDMIVRQPVEGDANRVPVGVVSKDYTLIQHQEVLQSAREALKTLDLAPTQIKADLDITENGERMHLSLFLPEEYEFKPADGHPMTLRLECINSVDGSTRFRALMGWFRLVCTNGMVLGVTRTDMHQRHVGDFRPEDIREVLHAGLKDVEHEVRNFRTWQETEVMVGQLADWVETPLRKTWGFKAAARAWHIAHTGCDVDINGPYAGNTPTSIPVISDKRVPGAPLQSKTLFDLSQILSWLARNRHDLQEQIEWREQIPALMIALNQQN